MQVAVEKPVPQAALEQAEKQRLDQLVSPSKPFLRMAATSSMRVPWMRSMVSTRALVRSQYTCATRMFLPSGDACMCDTQASIDCASRRKSSSSARLSAKSATTSCADSR